jgi:3',5'-cyclic-AMP phosphodiesterase
MRWWKAMVAVMLLSLVSCKDLFQYSPNEVRLEEDETNVNLRNIQRIEALPQRDTLKFILIGDSQRFYDETADFVTVANQRNDISFVVLAGDISDFGLNKEFKWVNRELKKLKVPYIGVIGNHDMLANGRLVFNKMYGPDNFAFTCNDTRIICLNTNSREVGFDGSLPNLSWLNTELKQSASFKNAFVISHVPPFDHADFDQTLERPYANLLASSSNVLASLHAHEHTSTRVRPYESGMEYFVTATVNKRIYSVISVWDHQYTIEEVEY